MLGGTCKKMFDRLIKSFFFCVSNTVLDMAKPIA